MSIQTNNVMDAFRRILDIPPEDFQLIGVKAMGIRHTSLDKTYKFLAILIVPSIDSNEDLVVDSNTMVNFRNQAQHGQGSTIKTIARAVKWKKKTSKGIKTKRFNFVVELSSQTILEFEIINGVYYILAECVGSFY